MFSKVLLNRFRVTMMGLMALILLVAPLSISAQNISMDMEESLESQEFIEIEGKEKQEYLKALENSNIYKSNVSNKNLDHIRAIVTDLGEHAYADEDIIMINAGVINSNGNADIVYAFIGKDSKSVLKLSHFNIGEENVIYKDYDENGTLMLHHEYQTVEFFEGNLENGITHYSYDQDGISISAVDKDSFWYKFACGFSGLISCNVGCLAFWAGGPVGGAAYAACATMCQLVWGAGLC